ncbi:hypothetical protein SAMN04488118_10631 [Epibacterium ulvae]|uniref:Uncharacterized protein n=1 Tax=Epibacterium ulvae TaxID=1156985 RepID=A0A1G5QUA2_9RHOB|nr:hypothetical protein [Epibacterium ulvae]SCZ65433.1 hypothetical protein SAMN04488118_10631 [Epibacterium ulvae]
MLFLFIVLQWRTLGRLRRQLEVRFPGTVQKIWRNIPLSRRIGIIFSPAVFIAVSERMALLDLFVARPEHIPAWMMGDDEVAALVYRVNRHWSARVYKVYFELSVGFLPR